MSLREEMWKYEQITGESAEHVPIIKLGAFLDGYEMGLKALEQTDGDCISREAVIEHICENKECYKEDCKGRTLKRCPDLQWVLDLPSVTPQPKTGHWEYVQYDYNPNIGNWHCSECRNIVIECVNKNEKGGIPIYKYCPNCGAEMRGDEE